MKVEDYNPEEKKKNKVLYIIAGPNGKAVVGRISGYGIRSIGKKVNQMIPKINNVLHDGSIKGIAGIKFSKGAVMSQLDTNNEIPFDIIDVDNMADTGWKLKLFLQDVDDPTKTLNEILHQGFVGKLKGKNEEIDALKQKMEILLEENENLRQRDKMRERELNEWFRDRKDASWFGQSSGE